MKKLYAGIIVGTFLLSTFMALNLYNSTSFPGYGGNKECNYCHNQPAFVKDVDASFSLANHSQAATAFANTQWAMDEVPIIQTNNRSESNLEFASIVFLKNSTDIMVKLSIPDKTFNNTSSATSDKFGLLFNIDVANYSVGQFLTNYNSTENNLDNVLTGQMAFENGHADFWYVDMAKVTVNSTGLADDKAISTGIISDGASHQDVHMSVWHGGYGHANSLQYDIFFVRALNTGDPNDAQFNVNGVGIHYAIADWDGATMTYHHSSFDQMIVVGDNNIDGSNGAVNGIVNTISTVSIMGSNYTTTYSEAASISSTVGVFTVVIVLAAIAIAIPVITIFFRPKK